MKPRSCPLCKKSLVESNDTAHYPFCSDRCKLIDLGAWATGEYAIATDESVSHDSLPED